MNLCMLQYSVEYNTRVIVYTCMYVHVHVLIAACVNYMYTIPRIAIA